MKKSYFPIITLGWITTTVLLVGLSLLADYNRLEKSLSSDAHYVYSSVYEKTYINEILLQNFTVLVSARPDDLEAIRSFANEMRKRYPHIERLQIQQQGPSITSSFGSNSSYNINPQDNSYNSSFPVTFIEPLTPDTRYLLNQDLLADSVFSETISFARRYHQPVASPPFPLGKRITGYGLFLAFFDRNTPP